MNLGAVLIKKIVFCTFQVGCANNLIPVALHFLSLKIDVTILCGGSSTALWEKQESFHIVELSHKINLEKAQNQINELAPNIVITGTDSHSLLEYNIRLAAIKSNIQSISFLDYWSVYRERFYRDNEKDKHSIPNIIMTIDKTAKSDLIASGFDPSIIEVVGSPSYENICLKYRDISNLPDTKSVRILFLSQPIFEIFADKFGLNEREIIDFFIEGLKRVNIDYTLIIKPHPREDPHKFDYLIDNDNDKYGDPSIKILAPEDDIYETLPNYDLISGIVSSVLMEAAVLGRKTLSIQYGSNGDFEFFGTREKIIPTIFKIDDLKLFFKNYKSKKLAKIDLGYLYEDATINMVNKILALAKKM